MIQALLRPGIWKAQRMSHQCTGVLLHLDIRAYSAYLGSMTYDLIDAYECMRKAYQSSQY